ncbi:threonine/serine exporter family protein [Nocardia cyriacigeorgica]|uniref:threonine/serine exporter family protein n=1 Tax=Nocardia cyriacigeorgica TaxID=135487 RepID=UPI002457CD70|nr:threonine/serine exporter family protein [Nocardia cyriacigeorgica]
MSTRESEEQRVLATLDFLSRLAVSLLEAGFATGMMLQTVSACAAAMRLDGCTVTGMGRIVTLEYVGADDKPVTRTVVADTLDAFDCDRMKRLKDVAREVVVDGLDAGTAAGKLAAANRGPQPWPQWFVPIGGGLLALCIAVQVGGSAAASVLAGVVFVVVNVTGLGLGRLLVPKLYAVALQTLLAATFAGVLHGLGVLSVTEAAVLLATNAVLLVPMPQLVSTAIDAVNADSLTALARASSALLAIGGIALGATGVLALSERLSIGPPVDPQLPTLPIWLGIVFAILGSLCNAVLNRGGRDLLLPAAVAGLLTAAVNQTLLHAGNLSPVWSTPLAAVVLGFASAAVSERLRLPISALALVGITGALLPGLTLYQGLISELDGQSGGGYFGQVFAILIGIGVGVSLGILIYLLISRRPLVPSAE